MVKIGLEVHVYPLTNSKMHCTCSTKADKPNTKLCPICTGQPGSKPMAPNKKALLVGAMIAKALHCKFVSKPIHTLRKHYFYPDLPNNYQRTSQPFAVNGKFLGIRIREVHWEEDAGRYDLHKGLVDLNRSGTPLLEIVTEPDIHSANQAREFLSTFRELLQYLGVARDTLKTDVNVSSGGARVEIKNINSVRGVETAIKEELKRQAKVKVIQETRHYNEATGRTISLRKKEETDDYCFIIDPDLPPISFDFKVQMPEDLFVLRKRLVKKYKINLESSLILTQDQRLVILFEELCKDLPSKFVADWIQTILLGELSYRNKRFSDYNIKTNDLLSILTAVHSKKITSEKAVQKIRQLLDTGKTTIKPTIVSDEEIYTAIIHTLSSYPKELDRYKKGKHTLLNFFLGQVLKHLDYQAQPERVLKKLKVELLKH